MLEVDIILNGGGLGFRRCIQRIVIWNVSDLADVSDYEYAISYACPMGEMEEIPSGRELAEDPELCEIRGEIKKHPRSSPPLSLVRKVLDKLDFSPAYSPAYGELA